MFWMEFAHVEVLVLVVKRNQQRCLEWWVPGWSWHWQGQKARQVGGKAGHKAIASAFSSLAPLRPQATKTSTFNSLSLLMGVIKGIQVNLALGLLTPWRIVSKCMYLFINFLVCSYFHWGRNCQEFQIFHFLSSFGVWQLDIPCY